MGSSRHQTVSKTRGATMPIFKIRGRTYHNPVELADELVGGRWKMPILWRLQQRVWRYGEFKKSMEGISHKMLSQQLKQLERNGLLIRKAHSVTPPRVDYKITPRGRKCLPAIEAMRDLGLYFKKVKMKRSGRPGA